MCNHYASSGDWRTKMGVFRQTDVLPGFDWDAPRPNVQSDDVYPTSIGEILRPVDGQVVATSASWLFMPWKPGLTWAEWSKTRRGCNNARGEEADTKWPFGPSAKRGRCLIPGEAFCEWNDDPPKAKDGSGGKTEYKFSYPDDRAFFFAGLCNAVEPPDAGPMLTYTMITKAAGGDTASIGHPRQPVILAPDEVAAWLDPERPIKSFTERLDPAGTFELKAIKGPKAVTA